MLDIITFGSTVNHAHTQAYTLPQSHAATVCACVMKHAYIQVELMTAGFVRYVFVTGFQQPASRAENQCRPLC